MKIKHHLLKKASEENIISEKQVDDLWSYLQENQKETPQFKSIHVLYYFGAMIVITALGWFMNEAWDTFGAKAVLGLGVAYGIGLFGIAYYLWYHKNLKIPGGVLATASVCMVPLVIYGIQKMMGWWPQGEPGKYYIYHSGGTKGSWLYLEIATIIASLIVLRVIRFPLVLAPAFFSLYHMSIDLTPLLFGKENFTWRERDLVTMFFGLFILVLSYIVDMIQKKDDYAFWGYLFGMIAFWGTLSTMHSGSEISKLMYCVLNVFLIFLSLYMRRIVFLVCGVAGVFGYIGHLARSVFSDSLAFPIILSLVGLGIIFLGIHYQKKSNQLNDALIDKLPNFLLAIRPPER